MTRALPRPARATAAIRRAVARTLTIAVVATLALVGAAPVATAADVGQGGATLEDAVPLPGGLDDRIVTSLGGTTSQWYAVTSDHEGVVAMQVEVLDGPAPWVQVIQRSDGNLLSEVGGWYNSALFDLHFWATADEEYLVAFHPNGEPTTVRTSFSTAVPPEPWIYQDPTTLELSVWVDLTGFTLPGGPITSVSIWCMDLSSSVQDPVRCATVEPNDPDGFGGVVDIVRGRVLAVAVSVSNGVVESARSRSSNGIQVEAQGEATITTEPASPVAGEPFDLVLTPTSDGVARPDMYPVLSLDGVRLPNPVQVGDRWVFRGLVADAGARGVTGVVYGAYLVRGFTVDGVSIEVARAPQTIMIDDLASPPYYGGPPAMLTAPVTSGLPVTLAASGSCTLTGTELFFTGVGPCEVVATQDGDANHLPASATRTFEVDRRPQTLTVTPLPALVYGQAPVTLEASSDRGLPVALTAAGACTVTGSQLAVVATGDCTVTASQGGDALTAPVTAVLHAVVAKRAQPVTLVLGAPAAGSDAVPVTATSAYGLPVTVTATGACALTDGLLRGVGLGECVVVAEAAGDGVSEPGRAEVTRTAQSLVMDPVGPGHVHDGAPVTLTATASSGLPVTFVASGACSVSGDELSFTGTGTCEVVATQGGNATFLPGSTSTTADVARRTQTVTVAALGSLVYGHSPVTPSGTSSVGLPVTFTAAGACTVEGGRVVTVATGECVVTAHQAGDAVTEPASAQVTTVVVKRPQRVDLSGLTLNVGLGLGLAPVPVTATSEFGLPVTVSASGACLLADGMLRGVGAGECVVVARADGDAVTEPGSAEVRLAVTAALSAVQPRIDGDLGDTASGAPVRATGTGLLPGSELVLEVRSTPRVIGTAVVGADGTATVTGVLPADLEAGDHHLVAIGTSLDGARTESAVSFSVAADGTMVRIEGRALVPASPVVGAVPAATSGLAATGADAAALGGPSALAVLLGMLLLALRRRIRLRG